jgi:hypothetical protein
MKNLLIGLFVSLSLIFIGIIIYYTIIPLIRCKKSGEKCSNIPCCTVTDNCLDGTCQNCLAYITNICKPGGTMSCEEYAECIQRNDITALGDITGCTNWFSTNCANFKPGSGTGTITGDTLTWSGMYYRINAFFGGTAAAIPGVDFDTISTLVLNIDFSDSYKNNNTGSFVAFGVNTLKPSNFSSKFSKITATVNDSSINIIPFAEPLPNWVTSDNFTKNSNVYIFDSTIPNIADSEIVINTDTNLADKQLTFTITFTS